MVPLIGVTAVRKVGRIWAGWEYWLLLRVFWGVREDGCARGGIMLGVGWCWIVLRAEVDPPCGCVEKLFGFFLGCGFEAVRCLSTMSEFFLILIEKLLFGIGASTWRAASD